MAGLQMLGLPITPQQLVIGRVLEARKRGGLGRHLVPARNKVAIQAPRRCGKTSGIWAVLVGRCETQPGYEAITTAQSGKRARTRLLKVGDVLERRYPNRIKVGRGIGNEHITWIETGSRIEMFPPVPGAFRGEGKSAVLLDEAQEIDEAEEAEDLIQAIMPLFDTEPQAQLIVAGTAGEHRAGMLWHAIERGRGGKWAIVDYAAPDGSDAADEKVWLATHPGIGTLTTLGIIRERWDEMKGDVDPTKFAREYLGMWPTSEQIRLIPEQAWEACYAGDGRQPRPQPGQAVIGYDVAPNDSAASIVLAWRDEHGLGRLKVLDHGPGHTWMPERLRKMSTQLRAPIAYDAIGPNVAVAEALVRKAPRPKLAAANVRQMQAGCAQLLAEIKDRTIRHEGEAPLDEAVAAAAKRAIGEGGWVWGRRASVGDISALIAATAALRAADELPREARPAIRTARR